MNVVLPRLPGTTRAMRLPSPGLAWGDYPQRDTGEGFAAGIAWLRRLASHSARSAPARMPDELAAAYQTARHGLSVMTGLTPATAQVMARLRRDGLTPGSTGQALALAAEVMQRRLGLNPYDTQVLAAWLMLKGQLVEMATGEGKTVAAALAAAVAALAGTPVHLLTANEYLVQRDRDTLSPFFAALGLTSASVTAALDGKARQAAWRAEIVYTTASQLAFDYLRDHLHQQGERDARVHRAQVMEAEGAAAQAPAATLPGLCLCLVDEADSILLDEAVVPLLLAGPAGQLDQAAYRRAFELSSSLQRQRDYLVHPASRRATLTTNGRERVTAAVANARGDLYPARRACELVEAALAARLLYRRDHEYAVVKGELQLIDELTGRIAVGRQWQGALHPMVQIKEGLPPSPPTATLAQITYQRFFPRYLHLCGMSGTLLEARHELRLLYGCPVARVPLAQASRRRWLGQRCYATATFKWQAVVQAVQLHAGAGRAVLVGTDSVSASAQLSALLGEAGLQHQLLNATQDGAEADQIKRAGISGCITIATNMAGRGTDIRLDDGARAAGGLHVIMTMKNRSHRIDRQLLGRAARQGDPGSAEAMLSLDETLLKNALPKALLRGVARWTQRCGQAPLPTWLAQALFGLAQRSAEWQDRQHRRELRHADEDATELFGFSGGTE